MADEADIQSREHSSWRADSGGNGPTSPSMRAVSVPRGDSSRRSGQFQRPASGRSRTRSKDVSGYDLNTDAYTVDGVRDLAIHRYVRAAVF